MGSDFTPPDAILLLSVYTLLSILADVGVESGSCYLFFARLLCMTQPDTTSKTSLWLMLAVVLSCLWLPWLSRIEIRQLRHLHENSTETSWRPTPLPEFRATSTLPSQHSETSSLPPKPTIQLFQNWILPVLGQIFALYIPVPDALFSKRLLEGG